MRRVALAVAAAMALAGLVLWRRSQGGGAVQLPAPPAPAPPAAPPLPSPPSPTRGPTREELYARAQELDIKGRSKMNKAELEQAVGEYEGG